MIKTASEVEEVKPLYGCSDDCQSMRKETHMQFNTHTLANGASLVTFSPHGFKFSDNTECPPQLKTFCDFFTLSKKFEVVREFKGMKFTKTSFNLTLEQFQEIQNLKHHDILLMPFQLLQAVHDSEFNSVLEPILNAVAFNATKETSRSNPQDKVVDINNWSVLR